MFHAPKDVSHRLKFTLIALSLGVSSMAQAQEVNLRSNTGTIDISGELIGFEDNNYIIETNVGQLRVDSSQVECIGAACPQIAGAGVTTVSWDVSLWGKRRAFTEHVEKLAELVSEKTDGDFQINLSYGGLSDSRENLDGIANDAFEMAQFCAGYHAQKNHAITVLELPFLGVASLEQEIAVSQAVYNHPATQAEMANWNATLLMPSPLPQYNLIGTGFPPTTLAEFEGLPVRATGGIGDALGSLGALLVPVPAPEVEQFMDAGIVEAVSFAPHAHMSFNTIENGTWWTTNLNPGTVNCPVVVNSDALSALPDAFRAALLDSVDEALDHYVAYYEGATMDAWGPTLRERQIMELTINDGVLDEIRDAVAAPAAAQWITDNAARGLPAQELYDLVIETISNNS